MQTLPTMHANPRGSLHRMQALPVGDFEFQELGTILGYWCAYRTLDLPLHGNQDSPTLCLHMWVTSLSRYPIVTIICCHSTPSTAAAVLSGAATVDWKCHNMREVVKRYAFGRFTPTARLA